MEKFYIVLTSRKEIKFMDETDALDYVIDCNFDCYVEVYEGVRMISNMTGRQFFNFCEEEFYD